MRRWLCLASLAAAFAFAGEPPRLIHSPNGERLPNAAPENRGTAEQQLQYGLAMGRAYHCLGLQAQDFMNYGCYCGEGNTGVDSAPADGVDAACRMHDLNLWAISENPVYNNRRSSACNCYTEVLVFTCRAGEIVMGRNLTPCQRACEQDLVDMTKRTSAIYAREYNPAHLHRWRNFGSGFPIPSYCLRTTGEVPLSPFATAKGIFAPEHEFWPVGKL